jgi:anti-sigma B factor antagonist
VSTPNPRPIITIRPPEDFDVYTAAPVREEFIQAIERDGAGTVVADLEGVRYMDNAGLGVLVGALKRARAQDCKLVVVCTDEWLLKVFRVTGMSNVFDIRPTADGLTTGETATTGEKHDDAQ